MAGAPPGLGWPDAESPAPIRTGIEDYRVGAAGYLYCFANDARNFYDNNRGSVRLTVLRSS